MQIEYCPYCGHKLEPGNNVCPNCQTELSFEQSDSLDESSFEELMILHQGVKMGKRTFVFAVILTILCFFLPIFFLSVNFGTNLAPLIVVQILIYAAIIGDFIVMAYSIIYGRRCTRHGYNQIGWFKASFWASIFGTSFGVLFIIVIVTKIINPGAGTTSTGPVAIELINTLLNLI